MREPWIERMQENRAMDFRAGAHKGTCLHPGAAEQGVFEKPLGWPAAERVKMRCPTCGLRWTRIIRA